MAPGIAASVEGRVTRPNTAQAGRVRWTALDALLIVALTCIAGFVRHDGITHPGNLVFDEFYASDACLYVLGPGPQCATTTETSVVHPPMGKWLIAAGIRVFGFTPAGWRVVPLFAGTLTVAVLYLLARRLLESTLAASLAAGLLAFDPLHFVMSRTAMLDVFVVLFGLVAFLCLVYDITAGPPRRLPDTAGLARRCLARPWLLGAGFAGGAAMASKWSGLYLFAAVVLLAVRNEAGRVRSGTVKPRDSLRRSAPALVFALMVVPAAVYVASFAGRLPGTLAAWPWASDSWGHAFVARHVAMVSHHTGALYAHPYTSSPWAWPLIQRPVLFYFRQAATGEYEEILALGNPPVWWPGLIAIAAVAWRMLRRPQFGRAVILAGFVAGYFPWFIITRREAFLYYFLPAVPFLYIALAQVTSSISPRRVRALVAAALAAGSIGAFVFFRPVLTAGRLSYPEWERRIWFQDCGPVSSGPRKVPVTRPVPPPSGWCWL